MNLLFCIFLGAVAAFALRKGETNEVKGLWCILVGVLAAILPHMDALLLVFGNRWLLMLQNGPTWSLLLAPLFAMIPAFTVEWLSGRKVQFKDLYLTSLAALCISILLGIFTGRGVDILWPIPWRVGIDLIFEFDMFLFFVLLGFLAICFCFRRAAPYIARAAFVVIVVYLLVVSTFKMQAENFGKEYAHAFSLKVKDIHSIAQPISPMNWRVIVETEDKRLHDTLINLKRKEPRVLEGHAPRVARIDALYMPLDEARWRIYKRFGNHNSKFARVMFEHFSGHTFDWLSRYAVLNGIIKYNGNDCAEFRDLRFDGAKRYELGAFLVCREGKQAVLYQADKSGVFFKLEAMY